MKTSSTQSPKQPQPKSLLLIGPPGGGKTTLVLQFPRLLVLDCGAHFDGPEKELNRQKITFDYQFEPIWQLPNGNVRPIHECYDALLAETAKHVNTKDYDWIAIDDVSTISEWVKQKIYYAQKVQGLEMRHWDTYQSELLKLIMIRTREFNCGVILTSHEIRIEKADKSNPLIPQIVGLEPSVQGRLAQKMGGFFSDIWRMEAKPAPGNQVEFILTTQRTTLSELKNSIGLPSEIKNPTYKELEPYLKGTKV